MYFLFVLWEPLSDECLMLQENHVISLIIGTFGTHLWQITKVNCHALDSLTHGS